MPVGEWALGLPHTPFLLQNRKEYNEDGCDLSSLGLLSKVVEKVRGEGSAPRASVGGTP